MLMGVLALLGVLVVHGLPGISTQLDLAILSASQAYSERFEASPAGPALLLPLVAFGGGVLASVSPCVLAMLPLNLSYIGTLGPLSRLQAIVRVGGFVAGIVVVLSLFGLIASFASAIVVDHRGPVHLVVGLLILVMGLNLGGVAPSDLAPSARIAACRWPIPGGGGLRSGQFPLRQSGVVFGTRRRGQYRLHLVVRDYHGELCPGLDRCDYRHQPVGRPDQPHKAAAEQGRDVDPCQRFGSTGGWTLLHLPRSDLVLAELSQAMIGPMKWKVLWCPTLGPLLMESESGGDHEPRRQAELSRSS